MIFLKGFLFPIFVCIFILIGFLYLVLFLLIPAIMFFFYWYFCLDDHEILASFYILLCFCIISGAIFCLFTSDTTGSNGFDVCTKPFVSYAEFMSSEYSFLEEFLDCPSSD